MSLPLTGWHTWGRDPLIWGACTHILPLREGTYRQSWPLSSPLPSSPSLLLPVRAAALLCETAQLPLATAVATARPLSLGAPHATSSAETALIAPACAPWRLRLCAESSLNFGCSRIARCPCTPALPLTRFACAQVPRRYVSAYLPGAEGCSSARGRRGCAEGGSLLLFYDADLPLPVVFARASQTSRQLMGITNLQYLKAPAPVRALLLCGSCRQFCTTRDPRLKGGCTAMHTRRLPAAVLGALSNFTLTPPRALLSPCLPAAHEPDPWRRCGYHHRRLPVPLHVHLLDLGVPLREAHGSHRGVQHRAGQGGCPRGASGGDPGGLRLSTHRAQVACAAAISIFR